MIFVTYRDLDDIVRPDHDSPPDEPVEILSSEVINAACGDWEVQIRYTRKAP